MQLHDAFGYSVLGVKGVRPMSAHRYSRLKGEVLPELRQRGDPPPRRMRAGEGPRDEWHANLRRLLATTPGGTLVRGFKLFTVQVDPAVWKQNGWLATAHAVVAAVTPSGTTVYNDPNAQVDSADEYIFVPSARVHPELTDAQLLSAEWHLGSVVGGAAAFRLRFIAHERLQGRARSVVGARADALVSKPAVVVRLPPHFLDWFRVNELRTTPEELAELMGAPVFPCNAATGVDDGMDALAAYAAVERNGEACVDGKRGLRLELHCREQLLRGEMSIAEARRRFFSHYDAAFEAVRRVQTRRFAEWCEAWKQAPPGGV